MPYPTIPEQLFSKSAFGVAKETTFRTPVTPTSFTPFSSCTLEYDPAIFSPPVMIGVRSTHIYNLSGDEKVSGAVGAPLYSVNGIPLLVASVGQDASSHNGVFGAPALASAGTPGSAGSSTSFAAAGVTSITLTGITGTFAVGQTLLVRGSTDPIDGPVTVPDVVRVTAFSSPTLTVTPTARIHTGTITVSTVGSSAPGTEAALAATITVATGQGALFTTGDIVTIDANGSTTTAESRKVTVSGDVLTLDVPLTYSHAANAVVYHVGKLGLFWHTVPLGDVDSFTFEKNIANKESLQFAGSRVGKMTLHAPMGNNASTLAADIQASALAILPTPTAVVTDPNPPFTFKEASLNIFGVGRYESYNHQLVLDNGLKETRTYSGHGLPSYVTATDLHVTGSFDAIWDSFDDSTTGYFKKMQDGTEGDFNFTLQHPADGSFIYWDCPKVRLSKDNTAPTPANIAMQSLAFDARYAIESSSPSTITLILGVPGQYLPY
jgi:hypothetical protein